MLEDIIVDASIYPDLSSERNAVYEHLNATLDLDIFHNSILIFDRGYYSARIYCDFYNRGLLCLMRVKESLKITRSDSDDSIQFIKDPASGLDVPVRVIRVVLDSGTVEYLVTNCRKEVVCQGISRSVLNPGKILRIFRQKRCSKLAHFWLFRGCQILSFLPLTDFVCPSALKMEHWQLEF